MSVDTSQLQKLTDDIQQAIAGKKHKIRAVGHEVGRAVRDKWRANASETAGRHGVHYPRAISYDVKGGAEGMEIEVGPDSSRPQGGMGPGFEFGSVHQPAHLDGQRALDASLPNVIAAVAAMAPLFD